MYSLAEIIGVNYSLEADNLGALIWLISTATLQPFDRIPDLGSCHMNGLSLQKRQEYYTFKRKSSLVTRIVSSVMNFCIGV